MDLDNVKMLFPAANRRVLDEVGITSAETLVNMEVGGSTGGRLRAVNSTFEWNDHVHLFDRVGKGAFFSDCTFMRQGYALGESATLSDGGQAAGLVFQHNLVTIFNSFVGITPGLTSTLVRLVRVGGFWALIP